MTATSPINCGDIIAVISAPLRLRLGGGNDFIGTSSTAE